MTLVNPGMNTIRRRSEESSVTIPFERTFRNVDANRPLVGAADELEFNFCGCGWPQHMLIPKGKPEGLTCQLFVMISNYEDDRVRFFLAKLGILFFMAGFYRLIKIWWVVVMTHLLIVEFVTVYIPIVALWVFLLIAYLVAVLIA